MGTAARDDTCPLHRIACDNQNGAIRKSVSPHCPCVVALRTTGEQEGAKAFSHDLRPAHRSGSPSAWTQRTSRTSFNAEE